LEWIVDGLVDLRKVIIDKQIQSIAIPALGAGLGGLRWEAVRGEIDRALHSLDDVDIRVFVPLVHG
jgi:O-acetyl-ADP-ribose deacetylase (regulator of RNase III)